MQRFQRLTLGLAFSVALGASGCSRQNVEVAKLKEELAQEFNKELKPEARRQAIGEFRERLESLSEEQRREVMQVVRENFRRRETQRLNEYLQADAKTKQKLLDDDINEMEKRRKERESRQQQGDRNGGGGGPGGGPPGGPPGGAPGGGPGGPGGWGGGMAAGLARSSPDERAARAVYMEDMSKRRQQRGLPPMPQRR